VKCPDESAGGCIDNHAAGIDFAVGNIVGLNERTVACGIIAWWQSSALYGSGGIRYDIDDHQGSYNNQGLKASIFKLWPESISVIPAPSLGTYYDAMLRYAQTFNNLLSMFCGGITQCHILDATIIVLYSPYYQGTPIAGSTGVLPKQRIYNGVNVTEMTVPFFHCICGLQVRPTGRPGGRPVTAPNAKVYCSFAR